MGDVASEEGLCASLRDAQLRHLKRPHDVKSYIPTRVQASALHGWPLIDIQCRWLDA